MSPPDCNYKKGTCVNRRWHTYLWSLALLLCSCAEQDVLIDTSCERKATREVPIGFVGSYVDNALTRHDNALSAHLTTMGVWGWRNGMWDDNTLVFDNQRVAYNADSTRWEYAPLQYWREECQYDFHAYAPHQTATGAEVTIDPTTHMIRIAGVTLHGYNLQDTPSDSVIELFCNTPDTDWMISRAGQTAVGAAGMDVEFMMQHILAKLNIRIRASERLLAKRYISSITVDSIIVGALPAQGDFAQQLTHTPIISDSVEADIDEWTPYDSTLYIKGMHACTMQNTPTYLVEALVIPHSINDTSTVTLHYSYHFANGCSEGCIYQVPLASAFSRFVPGHSHTLTFTLQPKRITFEAGSSEWEKGI